MATTGHLDLPGSNDLAELHRVFRNLDQRIRGLAIKGGGTGVASGQPTIATGGVHASSASAISSIPVDNVSDAGYVKIQKDPNDGLVAVDSNGYAILK